MEQVKSIVLRHLAGYHAAVWLFGSRARGDAGPASDLDVAVSAAEPLPAGVLAHLREALDESRVPFRVDVVDLAEASPEYRGVVEREGIRWNG